MNSQQIQTALRGKINNQQINFLGCFSADEIVNLDVVDRKDKRGIVFIANILTKNQLQLMGHWIVFYIANKCIYFFDSYGLEPRLYSKHFINFLKKNSTFTILKNTFRLQADDTLVCGVYCCVFVFLLGKLGIMKTCLFITKSFSRKNFLNNDRKVIRYAYDHFVMPQCTSTFKPNSNNNNNSNINEKAWTYKLCIKKKIK